MTVSATRLSIFLGLLFLAVGASAAGLPFTWTPLREAYERNEPVELVVKNPGATDIRVYSNLQVVDGTGQWTTWPYRIEDARIGVVANLYLLAPGGAVTIRFDATRIMAPKRPVDETPKRMPSRLKFRFRVVALAGTSDQVLGETFTEPFYIKHPYP